MDGNKKLYTNEDVKNFLASNPRSNAIICRNFNERNDVIDFLESIGLKIGFDRNDFRQSLAIFYNGKEVHARTTSDARYHANGNNVDAELILNICDSIDDDIPDIKQLYGW